MNTLEDLPATIYLKKDFRNELFCKAYEKSGSLSGLGISLGYKSRPGLNGVPRDMWLGRSGIPKNRINRLLKLTGVSLKEFAKYIIPREQSEVIDNWMRLFDEYKLCTRRKQW